MRIPWAARSFRSSSMQLKTPADDGASWRAQVSLSLQSLFAISRRLTTRQWGTNRPRGRPLCRMLRFAFTTHHPPGLHRSRRPWNRSARPLMELAGDRPSSRPITRSENHYIPGTRKRSPRSSSEAWMERINGGPHDALLEEPRCGRSGSLCEDGFEPHRAAYM